MSASTKAVISNTNSNKKNIINIEIWQIKLPNFG